MAIRLNDVVQISVNATQSGQRITNVLHYIPEGAADPMVSSLGTFLTGFRALWRSEVLPLLVTGYQVQQYDAIVIAGTKPGPVVGSSKVLDLTDTLTINGVPADDTGSVDGDPLPTYATATFRKRTGVAGKRNRGSMRLGGIPESYTEPDDGNKLTTAGAGALDAVVDMLSVALDGVAGEALNPAVFSRTALFAKAGDTNNTTDTWHLITQVLLNPLVGSQLSRKQTRSLGA